MTLIFNRLLEVVKIHVRAVFRAGVAKRQKKRKFKKNHVKIQIVSFICVCVSGSNVDFVGVSVLMLLLTLRETYALNRLSSFKNLRRKGGKFDHLPGRPKVLLRH